jgi:NADH-quinone oxidoreductase subunit K
MPLVWPLLLSAALFGIGVYGVLARRNAVLALMGVELMLNAANVNLVAFDVWFRDVLVTGQVFTLFIIALAAAEIGLGLAIVLRLFRTYGHVDVDRLGEEPASLRSGQEAER